MLPDRCNVSLQNAVLVLTLYASATRSIENARYTALNDDLLQCVLCVF